VSGDLLARLDSVQESLLTQGLLQKERAESNLMKKGLTIGGGICLGVGLLTLIISSTAAVSAMKPQDHILHNTETGGGSFEFDGDTITIGVYAIGDHACSNVEITITDDNYEYFERDCNSAYDTPDYTYLGNAIMDSQGTYEISASEEIILVDRDSLAYAGLAVLAGGGCCLVGLTLLVVGLAMGRNNASTGNFIVFQDPMAQQQAQIGMVSQQPDTQYQQQPIQQQVIQQPIPEMVVLSNQLSVQQTPHPSSGIVANSGMSDGQEWLKHDGHIYYREIGSLDEWTKYQG